MDWVGTVLAAAPPFVIGLLDPRRISPRGDLEQTSRSPSKPDQESSTAFALGRREWTG